MHAKRRRAHHEDSRQVADEHLPAPTLSNDPQPVTTIHEPVLPRAVQHPYERDPLDRLLDIATHRFHNCTSWKEFVEQSRDPHGDIHPKVARLPHPAAPLLDQLRLVGAPVQLTTPPWNRNRITAALARGPHKSSKESIAFLREEFAGMMLKGHWTMLPARLVKDYLELRLSPLGVVPQRE